MRTHQDIDARSLAMHRVIAEKIRRDPVLFERVKHTLGRWRTLVAPASQPYLVQWQGFVDAGVEACLAVAVEESPRADALRQCSPFAGLLSNEERFALIRRWKSSP